MSIAQRKTSARRAARRSRPERTEGPASPPLFLPREVPTYEALEAFRGRFPELDPESLVAHLTLLSVVGAILSAADAYFARYGLSKGRFSVLVILLFEGDGGMSPSELAERAGVTRATITGLLDGLERDGLVRRERTAGDRRRLVVRVTSRGERVIGEFLPGHFERIGVLMGELDRGEKRELVRLLEKVRLGIPVLGSAP